MTSRPWETSQRPPTDRWTDLPSYRWTGWKWNALLLLLLLLSATFSMIISADRLSWCPVANQLCRELRVALFSSRASLKTVCQCLWRLTAFTTELLMLLLLMMMTMTCTTHHATKQLNAVKRDTPASCAATDRLQRSSVQSTTHSIKVLIFSDVTRATQTSALWYGCTSRLFNDPSSHYTLPLPFLKIQSFTAGYYHMYEILHGTGHRSIEVRMRFSFAAVIWCSKILIHSKN